MAAKPKQVQRYGYGELKETGTVAILAMVKPAVKEALEIARSGKSWGMFFEEVAESFRKTT